MEKTPEFIEKLRQAIATGEDESYVWGEDGAEHRIDTFSIETALYYVLEVLDTLSTNKWVLVSELTEEQLEEMGEVQGYNVDTKAHWPCISWDGAYNQPYASGWCDEIGCLDTDIKPTHIYIYPTVPDFPTK